MYFDNKINSRLNIVVLKPTAKILRPTAWISSFFHFVQLPGIVFRTLFKPAIISTIKVQKWQFLLPYKIYQKFKSWNFAFQELRKNHAILYLFYSTIAIHIAYNTTYSYTMLQWGFILLSYIFTLYSNIQILQLDLYSTLYYKGCVLCTFPLGVYCVLFY